MNNSKLLDRIMQHADELRKANNCPAVTRDYIVLSALSVLNENARKKEFDAETEEYKKLLEAMRPIIRGNVSVTEVLKGWNGKGISATEQMMLSKVRWQAQKTAQAANQETVTADIILGIIMKDEPPEIKKLHQEPAAEAPAAPAWAKRETPREQPAQQQEAPREEEKAEDKAEEKTENVDIVALIRQTKTLQAELQKSVLGQDYAVSAFAAGYFQAALQSAIEKKRTRPMATFLFAGPPGVGKTFLSEEAAGALGLPFRRFDMSEYSNPYSADELSGSDANFKGSSEGQLTGFVKKNPRCVVLLDEIEKASLEVIHLFLQVLDAGRLRDNRTDEEISFKDAILIFTTNAGKELYDGVDDQNLSTLPRDTVLDALGKDINPRTKEPFFPPAICSRFASGNVVMFNHLGAHTLRSIVENRLNSHIRDLQSAMEVTVEMEKEIPTAILLAEGAAADARRVKSRADSFFGGELFELYRLLVSGDNTGQAASVRQISVKVDLDQSPETVRRLFTPSERIHALVYSGRALSAEGEDPLIPILHPVKNAREARKIIGKENIQLLLCDLFEEGAETGYLNREDVASPARDFLYEILAKYPSMPVLLLEYGDRRYTEEEKVSFMRRGVRAFVCGDGEVFADQLRRYAGIVFQQNSLTELARANQLVQFETAQKVEDDRAEIILFDFRTIKSVKAEDADNVLSMLSTPDVKFDDIIGADDAKNELKFLAKYMKDPKRYRGKGAPTPKGLLLYGPPGTGKTMLAKAFAAESGATFIATEGSQFFNKFVGESAASVRRIFAAARRYAPSVLFVDEIDTIARTREGGDGTGTDEVRNQVLTTFFAEMDGFKTDPSKPVFVMGATNYGVDEDSPLRLDGAMLRRFDRRIFIDLPTRDNRKQYLNAQFKAKPIFHISPEMVDSLAERSAGMSLAQLASVLDMAMRDAVRTEREQITDEVMEETFEKFNSGERKQWSAETMLRTARHEAGHTVINWLAGERPSYVTIVSRGNYGGYMRHGDQEERSGYTKKELLSNIRTSLAGRAAEILYYGEEDGISTGASSDLRNATSLAQRMICSLGMYGEFGMAYIADQQMSEKTLALVNTVLKEQMRQAIDLLSAHREQIDRMVEELLKNNSLKREDIDRIMQM